jgi:Na+/melibiose symporter-like transporter
MENAWESADQPLPDELTLPPAAVAGEAGLDTAFANSGLVAPSTSVTIDEGSLTYEPEPISLGKALVYSSGNAGTGIFYAFNNYMQSFFLISLGAPPIVFALLNSQRSFEGAIIQPLVGAWSDRTWTRWGRQRIFILRFVPPCIVFTVITPFLPQAARLAAPVGIDPKLLGLIFVSASIFLFSITFNISQDPYIALLADITPQRQRGVVNGIFQSTAFIAQVAILLVGVILGAPYTVLYPLVGVSLLLFFIPTLLGVREPRRLPGASEHKHYTFRDYVHALGTDHEIQLYFAVQFLFWFGINAVVVFITPYAVNVVGLSERSAFIVPIILVVAVGVAAWPLGLLSSRLSLKGVFFLATAYPMLSRLVFPEQMGLYTGLNTTVSSLAAPLSSLIAGALVTGLGYGVLFMFVGIAFLLALVPLAFLRIERSVVARARAAAAASAQLATG